MMIIDKVINKMLATCYLYTIRIHSHPIGQFSMVGMVVRKPRIPITTSYSLFRLYFVGNRLMLTPITSLMHFLLLSNAPAVPNRTSYLCLLLPTHHFSCIPYIRNILWRTSVRAETRYELCPGAIGFSALDALFRVHSHIGDNSTSVVNKRPQHALR